MRQRWEDYDRAAEEGPLAFLVKFVVLVVFVVGLLGFVGYVGGWFGDAGKVLKDELGPQAMLQKYVWFKDAAAQLDQKKATIEVLEGRMAHMTKDNGSNHRQWTREDREQYNVWSSEVAGVKAGYNQLAGEYKLLWLRSTGGLRT